MTTIPKLPEHATKPERKDYERLINYMSWMINGGYIQDMELREANLPYKTGLQLTLFFRFTPDKWMPLDRVKPFPKLKHINCIVLQ